MLLFCSLAGAPRSATAQSLGERIAAAAQRSAEQLDPGRIGDVESAEADFLTARENLREHLSRTTTEKNAQAWIDYLQVEAVVAAIESGARDSEIAGKSTQVFHRSIGIHPGLEIDAVTRLRTAADRYSNALRFRSKESITSLLGVQLTRFAEGWGQVGAVPSPDELATLRLLLDLLERTGQQVDLVDRTRDEFAAANLHLMVDESLIQRLVNRDVNQCTSVRDCILGTRIVGSALLTGDVTATLLPSQGSVRMQIALNGTVTSNNRGYNGPVSLRTSGVGHVFATRLLHVSESGVVLDPVVVSGRLSTRINAIEHRLRLVRKIARKKAAQQKPQADRIANRKFLARVTEAFTEETDGAVSEPMPDLMAQARPYLARLNLSEPQRDLGSTSEFVYVNATVRQGNELAAPLPPPTVAASNEATIQIHESIVDNTIGAVLAGRTMTRNELQQMAENLRPKKVQAEEPVADSQAESSEAASSEEEEDPNFEIDFDAVRPVVFEARDGKLHVGIRGTRFEQGSRELKKRLEVVAVYQPITNDSGEIILERDGEVQINFPGTKRLSVREAGLRGAIKKGFADAFPEFLMHKPWIVPDDAKVPALRGRNFRPRYFDARDGWLTLGVSS